ncbi:MAG TPA: hypothetical protein VLU46_02075 [Thermoanaerobaculia bacterium]|nr:hypothetical protein [Thermoanaerobaculia bacterium]
MCRNLFALALFAIPLATYAQGPPADWRTVATLHFRIHYPAQYEQWTMRAASRLESMRAAVVKEVGFDAPQRVDVIVMNPIASANGAAFPFLGFPRIVLFTEPPAPDEQIGAYSDWIDLLAVHEITHVIHMLRPSRNRTERTIERFALPLDPITLSAPRWVLEGYATVVEGRLTGAGRPASSLRAAILRKWASSGRMPSYAQLNSDSRFLGMSMAYLAGSAYLEWLERRGGEGSLRKLWARMTARQRRSFDAAFTGVFGDSPQRLYGQFVAELTASAIAVNRAAALREGELWQETPRASGDPAVSPDGSQIAIVIREKDKPQRIVIWSTGPAAEEQKKFEKRIAEMLRRDPEDVAPVASKPLSRKPVKSFTPADAGDIETPRWTRDGKTILFSHRQPDREGFLHRDLFAWTPSTGASRRITRLGDVFDADPLPDGRTAVAVRSRYGLSQLVHVDLDTGAVTAFNEPSLDTVYSHPRASGSRTAYVAHRDGVWTLFVDDKPVVSDVNVASPEWQGDAIVATVLSGGYAELHRITPDGTHAAMTRSTGGAFEPAPSNDGRVFFMALQPDGFVLRTIDATTTAEAGAPYNAALVPALPPLIPTPPAFAAETVAPPRPYGIGPQEMSSFIGEAIAVDQNATELGVRLGDVVGRLDTLAMASIGRKNGQCGVAVASAWRGWPVAISAHLFRADDRIEKRSGVELRGSWTAQWPLTSIAIDAGGLTGNPLDIGFARAALQQRQVISTWRAAEEVVVNAERGTVNHERVLARLSLWQGSFHVGAQYAHDNDAEVGGIESSILPRSAIPNRVFDPALPIGSLRGRYDGTRIEASLPILPGTLFYQVHRAGGERLSVTGLETDFASPPIPIVRIPAFHVTAGVARAESRTRWWFGLRWRP